MLAHITHKDLADTIIIGDIHSSIVELTSVIQQAKERNIKKFVFLGDLWDRGHHPNEVIDLLYDMWSDGIASFVVGNHDLKFIKHFDNLQVNLGKEQQETLSLLTDSSISKFKEIFFTINLGIYDRNKKLFLSHAAGGRPLSIFRNISKDLQKQLPFSVASTTEDIIKLDNHAINLKKHSQLLYGVTNGDTVDGFPVRLPISKDSLDDLDGWTYVFGHIHANKCYPENDNKHIICVDFSCGEEGGKLCGYIVGEDFLFSK